MLDDGETIIVRVIHSRKNRIENKIKELASAAFTVILAAVFTYGLLSLIGLAFYLWWFTGVIILLSLMLVTIFGLLFWLEK